MKITAEAVEATARELWEPNEHDDAWVDDFATYQDFLRHKAIQILEAAAPHMLAQGWDEGYKAGLFDKEYYAHNPNPYRPTDAV